MNRRDDQAVEDEAPEELDREKRFDWPVCYEAEEFLLREIDAFLVNNSFARVLANRMVNETGTLFLDWIDHLTLPHVEAKSLEKLGYAVELAAEAPAGHSVFWHPEAMLPRVLRPITHSPQSKSSIALRVDSVEDFRHVHQLVGEPHGTALGHFRTLLASEEDATVLKVVERRGYCGYRYDIEPPHGVVEARNLWRSRRRLFDSDEAGFDYTHKRLDEVIALAGRDLACSVIFEEERAAWQSRNRAAQIQKARQDKLGLGWANHDHHTFRSSRKHFVDLMRMLEKLGFERRERYYAGAQAGWGAQILEQPAERIVAFCDVDLEPDETNIDFSREPLPAASRLGTIGLWIGLHGESILEAGLHHLECRFDHSLLRDQLAELDVTTMKPFSDLPFLKQAFTEGERWPVRPERAQDLHARGLITTQQLDQFLREGAIGSHLENLQRKGGFKGFNQTSVSAIIEATDPRAQHATNA